MQQKIDPANDSEVTFIGLQAIDGEMQRRQRGCTGGVDREARPGKSESIRNSIRCGEVSKTVSRIGRQRVETIGVQCGEIGSADPDEDACPAAR